MNKILIICICLIVNAMSQEIIVREDLDLYGTGQLTRVTLPYPYLPCEYEQTLQSSKLFLSQGLWSYARPDKVILTGTLSPCVALIAKYQAADQEVKALVAHLDYLADLRSLYDPIRQLAGEAEFDVSGLTIDLLTTTCENYETKIPDYECHSWKSLHGERSQLEHLKFLKDALCDHFELERTKVRARKFDPFKKIQSYGQYIGVGSQLAITSTGEVYMVSHFRSDPFMVKSDLLSIARPNDFFVREFEKTKTMAMVVTHLRLNEEQQKMPYRSYHTLYGAVALMSCSDFLDKYEVKQRYLRRQVI